MSTYTLTGTAIIHEFLDNEIIIANLDSGIYYSIRESGIPLWQLLVAGYDLAAIHALFAEKYSQNLTLADFVTQLVTENLLIENTEVKAQGMPENLFWPAEFNAPTLEKYEEMKDLLMLDPIHEVDEQGWPNKSVSI